MDGSGLIDIKSAIRVVIITLDNHLSRPVENAAAILRNELPGLRLSMHAAADWAADPSSLERARDDVAKGDIILVTMMFLEEHINAILPALKARRDSCDALVCAMSAGEIIRLTRMGPFTMDGSDKSLIGMLKKLRGSKPAGAGGSSGAGQMAMLRRLPKILRFLPGKAQDLRAYFLTLQYWLAGSQENVVNMVRYLVNRYADAERRALRGSMKVDEPKHYAETGLYHPSARERIFESAAAAPTPKKPKGVVGLLVLRSYVLADDAAHYDGVIRALEARGLKVLTAFAGGLDARPAIEKYFRVNGKTEIDALVSLTGFSLVGGPAYNDSKAAEEILAKLDVPFIAAHPLEFQTLQGWASETRGLSPVEATMMVAIPEIDGATGPMVYGGRADASGGVCCGCSRACAFDDAVGHRRMRPCPERADTLALRVEKLASLRRTPKRDRRIGIVLFNFPPNAGAAGTAAYLSVFESLFATLKSLSADGYSVEVPESVEALKKTLLEGNAERFGVDANVAVQIKTQDHVRNEPWLRQIEEQWGPAPGRQLTNGASIFVLGAEFGNIFVGLQPGFGYEGDPMRLLFESGFTPTHAFSAFYRYLREDFNAHALVHFGTHGALEFMPGKQTGLSQNCWPDRLIGNVPNIYLYAANNPSEGAIAKRRSAATLISYLPPALSHAGLYRNILELKETIDRWRSTDPDRVSERSRIANAIRDEAVAADLLDADTPTLDETSIMALRQSLHEIESSLIPNGLHVFGQKPTKEDRENMLITIAEASHPDIPTNVIGSVARGAKPAQALKAAGIPAAGATLEALRKLTSIGDQLATNAEMQALLHALDGGFIRPAPGGDLLRTPEILPTGRNLHGFDPFRIPSHFAIKDGREQAERLIARHRLDGAGYPRTAAIVLWGTDNLKTEGAPAAQALAMMGARPRFDSYGRLCGAELIPLEELGRPRIDVMVTLSGIFRDLLPLQTRMLAEAAYLAASADEPDDLNFIAAHARALCLAQGIDIETASLRVFSNADGAYGANVNQLIDAGCWNHEDELADAFEARKSFAYGRSGRPVKHAKLLQSVLGTVDFAYQNLDSVELGVTTIDHYVDTLGGIARSVKRARGSAAPVYISDQTHGEPKVRSLAEQVALETRTRTLNPKWYEGLLKHGHEGVRQIEASVTNTMGWSATTGEVAPWVYQQISETFVLDPELRERMLSLNPKSCARMTNRLLEACDRNYWSPDAKTLEALRKAGEDMEDRIEGVAPVAVSA